MDSLILTLQQVKTKTKMEKEIWANARTEDQKLVQAIIALSEVVTNQTTLNLGSLEWPTIQSLALFGGKFELDFWDPSTAELMLSIKIGQLNVYAFNIAKALNYEKQLIAFGGHTFIFEAGKQFTLIDNSYLVP